MRAMLWVVALTACACGPFFSSSRPTSVRVVRATLLPPDSQDAALGGTRPVQLAAVRIEQGRVVDTVTSSPVDPRTAQRMSVIIPRGKSYAVFLQTPRGNTASLGQLVARILWSDGHGNLGGRLHGADVDVDLGDLSIQVGSPGTLADNTVLVADTANPLLLTDINGDGLSDLQDADDEGDGNPDTQDPDADGDGLADLDQVLAAVPDGNGHEDADGVPDDLE